MRERGDTKRATNIATVRVLDILAAFALDKPEFGVTELAQKFGLTKNMVHRALVTLVDRGFLVRSPSGSRYELGFGVLALQNPSFPAPDFRSLAKPALEELHDVTGMTTQLSIRVGDAQVVIDGVEAYGPRATRPKIGAAFPLHASAASRAILAALSDDEVEGYIARNAPLKRFTEHTIVEPKALRREIAAIRRDGHAETKADYFRSGSGFSFAVMAADGLPHGAVTIGGPTALFPHDVVRGLLPVILPIIDRLRRECGLYESR